jgi:hypothetical protein
MENEHLEQPEAAIAEALKALLTNEELSDITLKGKDGSTVSCQSKSGNAGS